ncbi:transcriptional regulator family: Fungal Specific TF [Penicillium longicatenatum]|uniref:transcriptional regulator family: Fungal Specific TF n=1 Tax=Penicillium longicatenatum TaxID=1561947 RepID=UPI002547DE9D|nr:transcriptional regulator family: Fungal Specific TF [Penicillium longicatenatum]KAJ5631491.1 transcriptional regulator family: Fungal Specific TF [Penicillium longicatenatum]
MPCVPPIRKCKRCKEKQLKCDETRPRCGRCTSGGIECPGYIRHKFVDESAKLRRHGKTLRSRNERKTPSYQKNGLVSWRVEMGDRRTTRSMNSNQDVAQASDDSFMQPEAFESQTLARAREEAKDFSDPNETALENDQSCVPQRDSQRVSWSATNIDEGRSGTRPNHPDSSILSNGSTGTPLMLEAPRDVGQREPGEYYLPPPGVSPRHGEQSGSDHICSELTGNLLDLSSSDDFFSVHVPIRANDSSTLRYAMASIAAKHLGRVKNRRYSAGHNASASLHATHARVDWSPRAAKYYQLATAGLHHSTSLGTFIPSSNMAMSPIRLVDQWMRSYLGHYSFDARDETPRGISILRKTEELLAALESGGMVAAVVWDFGSLFETIQKLHIDSSPEFSSGIRAAFWNFVRLDLFSSYFNRVASNIDSERLTLWRCAGINIDNEGRFQLPLREEALVREYQAANGGLLLVFKIVNFLAKQKQAQLARWTGPPLSLDGRGIPSPSQNPFPDPAVWLRLCFELQAWVESLPETFRPFLRAEEAEEPFTIEGKPIDQIFYGRPGGAAAIQHYHFGRIALLLNQPTDPINSLSTSFDRLRGYWEVSREVEFHIREICGIALGRPPDAVRIFMIPTLFAVGQCLENPGEHALVTYLLSSVEMDLGWATDYTIQRLQAYWASWRNK